MAEQPDPDVTFQDWLADPENSVAADQFLAQFVAEDGVELLYDLLDAKAGDKLRLTARWWLDRLARQFDRWREQGMPVVCSPQVKVIFSSGPMEAEADRFLRQHLPEGTSYVLTSRHVKDEDKLPLQDWKVQIGQASAEGSTPLKAARLAVDVWRLQSGADAKPPALNAPSAATVSEQQARKQVS